MYDRSPHQLCLGYRAKYFVHMFASSRCLFCQVSTLLSSDWPIFGILTSDIQRLHESGLEQFKCRQRCGWCEASVGSRNQGCNYCLDTRNTKAGMCFKNFRVSQPHFYVLLLLSVNIFIINFITRHHPNISRN